MNLKNMMTVKAAVCLVFGALFLVRRKLRRPSMVYAPGEPWSGEEASMEEVVDGDNFTVVGADALASDHQLF